MNGRLYPPIARYLVLAPTVLFSMWLTSVGVAPLPRLAAGVSLGAVMILLVARYQRRRASASRA